MLGPGPEHTDWTLSSGGPGVGQFSKPPPYKDAVSLGEGPGDSMGVGGILVDSVQVGGDQVRPQRWDEET